MLSEPDPPHQRHDVRGGLRRTLLASTATLSLFVSLVGGFGYKSYLEAQDAVGHFPDVEPSTTVSAGPTQEDFGPCVEDVCNYLLLGSDSRENLSKAEQVAFGTEQDIGGESRSDTIMLVHTDPRRDKAVILSFPRDLWVDIPGVGMGKINGAFSGGLNGGGPKLVTRTVESLTGLDVNHVLYVDLAGFQGVVDALGGVEMCVRYAMNDPLAGLDIKAGCQHFDGYTGLAYVRTRHQPCDTVPDFARISRQQQFLRAIINKILQPSELVRLPTLIKPVARNLVTDPGFKLADIIYLVGQLNGISSGQTEFRAVPGTATTIYPSEYPGGISVVMMDSQAREIFRALREGRPLPTDVGTELSQTQISEAAIGVGVFDHGSGQAQAVLDLLGKSGFDISPGLQTYSSLGADLNGSAIIYKPGQQAMADVVATYLTNLPEVEAPRGVLGSFPIGIVLGPRYELPPPPDPNAQPVC
jgi:LCP family protein required for cell wall assembly